jgi:predicted DNA-binding antitoxin AbrB/MazE fold protein
MPQIIDATYDGHVFRPNQPINLDANTHVKIIIDEKITTQKEKFSFLKIAESMSFEGPADLSANIDKYLYENSDKLNE